MQKDGDKLMLPADWDDLLEKEFVDRPKAKDAITNWVESPTEKRILSVVAPPGNGKTWILKNLHKEWSNPGKRLVLWLDAPDIICREEEQDTARMIEPKAFGEWFENAWNHAARHCHHLRPISPIADFKAQIEALVEMLCDCDLAHSPVLIVDGYDEITERQAETLSLRLLHPFLGRSCTRLILAHRAEWLVKGLSFYKRQMLLLSERDPLSWEFALEQFQRLFEQKYPGHPPRDPSNWMKEQCQHYRWNHPFINRFLFECGLKSPDASTLAPLTSQNFKDCRKAVIERPDAQGNPRYPSLSPEEFHLLHQLATQFPDKWTDTEVASRMGISLMWMDARFTRLFNAGVIVNLSPSTFYQVADGIREISREISIET